MSLPLHLVLVNPEIPHNTGAIGRLCVGLDAPLHLIRPLGFALTSAWVKRAGMDYWAHLDLRLHHNWEDFLDTVRPGHLHFASTRGRQSLYACTFAPGDALVFGNESRGLPEPWYTQYAGQLFHIPMPGPHARSLNLANAAAVVAYEALRQMNASSAATPATDP
jgi:tRNA (cytidine/uridine-2'-O-)-methyltransferase